MSRPKPPASPPERGPRLTGKRNKATLARLPKVRVVPPVQQLLEDINAVARKELAMLAAAQQNASEPSATRAKALDSISSAVQRAHKVDTDIQAAMADELSEYTDDELRELEEETDKPG